MRFDFHTSDDSAAFFCRFHEHFFKQRKSHIVRARRRDEIAAAFDEFHSEHVDVFVSAICVLDFACALAECGRIENDKPEFFSVGFVFAQFVKHVGTHRRDVAIAVESHVFKHVVESGLRNVYGGHGFCNGRAIH